LHSILNEVPASLGLYLYEYYRYFTLLLLILLTIFPPWQYVLHTVVLKLFKKSDGNPGDSGTSIYDTSGFFNCSRSLLKKQLILPYK